jgi:hypothetical protein
MILQLSLLATAMKPDTLAPNQSLRGASRARIWSQCSARVLPARSAHTWRQILAPLRAARIESGG